MNYLTRAILSTINIHYFFSLRHFDKNVFWIICRDIFSSAITDCFVHGKGGGCDSWKSSGNLHLRFFFLESVACKWLRTYFKSHALAACYSVYRCLMIHIFKALMWAKGESGRGGDWICARGGAGVRGSDVPLVSAHFERFKVQQVLKLTCDDERCAMRDN